MYSTSDCATALSDKLQLYQILTLASLLLTIFLGIFTRATANKIVSGALPATTWNKLAAYTLLAMTLKLGLGITLLALATCPSLCYCTDMSPLHVYPIVCFVLAGLWAYRSRVYLKLANNPAANQALRDMHSASLQFNASLTSSDAQASQSCQDQLPMVEGVPVQISPEPHQAQHAEASFAQAQPAKADRSQNV